METEPRFDLEAAISNWRNELAGHPGITEDNLRELESHLRDAVAASMKSGCDSKGAFEQSLKQIGDTDRIISEHAKENAHLIWRDRFFWMSFAVLAWFAWSSLVSLLNSLVFKAGEIVTYQAPKLIKFFDLEWVFYYLPDWSHSITRFFSLGGIYLIIAALLIMRLSSSRATRLRGMISWLTAKRTRFVTVSVLLWLMTLDFLVPYFAFSKSITPENYWFVTHNAGGAASSIIIHLLILVSTIFLYTKTQITKGSKTKSSPVFTSNAIWVDRVYWMTVGLLLFLCFGMCIGILGNALWRTVDIMWIRVLLGVFLPIFVFGCTILLAKQGIFRIIVSAGNKLLKKPSRIIFLAILFFVVQASINSWINQSTAEAYNSWLMETGRQSSISLSRSFSLDVALLNFRWPAVLFGLLIWFRFPVIAQVKSRLIYLLSDGTGDRA